MLKDKTAGEVVRSEAATALCRAIAAGAEQNDPGMSGSIFPREFSFVLPLVVQQKLESLNAGYGMIPGSDQFECFLRFLVALDVEMPGLQNEAIAFVMQAQQIEAFLRQHDLSLRLFVIREHFIAPLVPQSDLSGSTDEPRFVLNVQMSEPLWHIKEHARPPALAAETA